MKIYLLTLGCKVNQHESQQAADQLVGQGHHLIKDVNQAEIVLINTCTVTQVADKKSRQMIRQLARKNPCARIVVTGCMPENPAVPIEIPSGGEIVLKADLPAFLLSLPKTEETVVVPSARSRVRRTLLAQTGCDYFCSYCIIPTVRHGRVSVSRNQVLSDFQKLVKAGTKEIVLTGINLATWQNEGLDFTGLIKELLITPGDYRIRLGSLEPNLVTPALLALIESEPRVAPHLHIPLQGATDNLLKKMRRRYAIFDYRKLIDNIRAMSRLVSITTDLIVGFPTETEEDMQVALALIRKNLFLDVHAFTYSARIGTDAAKMEQVPASIVRERMSRVLSTIEAAKKVKLASLQGKTARVLAEATQKAQVTGHTESYVKVILPVGNFPPNQFVDIVLNKPILIGKEWGMSCLVQDLQV